jgi:hypothetical protein
MQRAKGLAFVIVLSLVSAVSLRLLLGRATTALDPGGEGSGGPPPRVTPAEVERRFVGCGRFHFAFDSLGYSSRQWPAPVAGRTSLANQEAVFVARRGLILPVSGDTLAAELGSYRVVETEVRVALGTDTALLAVLRPRGDSLAGSVALRGGVARAAGDEPGGELLEVGRVFLETPVPRPPGCEAAAPGGA